METFAGCIECGWTSDNPGERCGGCGAPLVMDAVRLSTHGQVVQVLPVDDDMELFIYPKRGRPYAVRFTGEEAKTIGRLLNGP